MGDVTCPGMIVLQQLLRRVLHGSDFSYAGLGESVTALQGMRQEELRSLYTPESIKAAVLMVTTLPVLLVHPLIQRYSVKGILIGSLKG